MAEFDKKINNKPDMPKGKRMEPATPININEWLEKKENRPTIKDETTTMPFIPVKPKTFKDWQDSSRNTKSTPDISPGTLLNNVDNMLKSISSIVRDKDLGKKEALVRRFSTGGKRMVPSKANFRLKKRK